MNLKKILLALLLLTGTLGFSQKNLVKFKAEIINRNSDSLFLRSLDGTILKSFAINKDNRFNTTFNVKEGLYQIFDSKEYTEVYLKNGYDLMMKLDAENFDKSVTYSGIGSSENNFLADRFRGQDEYSIEKIMNASEAEFPKLIDLKKEYDLKKLKEAKIDPNLAEILSTNQKAELTELEHQYKQNKMIIKLKDKPSPSFDFTNYNGGTTKLEDLKGKYVLIDIWATWCAPCIQEIPFLKEMEEKYRGKNIEFVSISVDEEKDIPKWKNMVATKAMKGIQLHADKNWYSDFIMSLALYNIPRFMLIDPNGIILNANIERPSDPKLTQTLDKILN